MSAPELKAFIAQIKRLKWVVNSKPGFNGSSSVLEYLGRYTHKIAISNYRLLSLDDSVVTFSYRDRNAGDVKRTMSLPVKEFLCRFALHILPKGFVKMRHYGLFSSRVKASKLTQVRKALQQEQQTCKEKLSLAEVVLRTTGVDITRCKACGQGNMKVFHVTPPPRGSPRRISIDQNGMAPLRNANALR